MDIKSWYIPLTMFLLATLSSSIVAYFVNTAALDRNDALINLRVVTLERQNTQNDKRLNILTVEMSKTVTEVNSSKELLRSLNITMGRFSDAVNSLSQTIGRFDERLKSLERSRGMDVAVGGE